MRPRSALHVGAGQRAKGRWIWQEDGLLIGMICATLSRLSQAVKPSSLSASRVTHTATTNLENGFSIEWPNSEGCSGLLLCPILVVQQHRQPSGTRALRRAARRRCSRHEADPSAVGRKKPHCQENDALAHPITPEPSRSLRTRLHRRLSFRLALGTGAASTARKCPSQAYRYDAASKRAASCVYADRAAASAAPCF